MVTSFGCCCADCREALQNPNCWRSCKIWGKMGEGEIEGDKDMLMEVECVWTLGRMGDIELHEGRYWDVGLCTGVGGSGAIGGSVGVDGTDSVGSGGGVGGGCSKSNGAGSVGGG